MPFASKAQARFAHANPGKFGGESKLKEWDEATDFGSLPEHTSGSKMGSGKWMQKASEDSERKGTKGVFKAAAQKAGKSTREYAEEKKHASGKTGARARLALAYMSAKH